MECIIIAKLLEKKSKKFFSCWMKMYFSMKAASASSALLVWGAAFLRAVLATRACVQEHRALICTRRVNCNARFCVYKRYYTHRAVLRSRHYLTHLRAITQLIRKYAYFSTRELILTAFYWQKVSKR